MADTNFLDLVSLNNADPIIGLVETAVFSYPELSVLEAVPHPGTTFEVAQRTVLPVAQFAQLGAGVPTSKSTFTLQRKEMYLMNTQLEVGLDTISAQTKTVGDILAIEAQGQLESNFYHITQQLYYGNSGTYGGSGYTADSLGFPGYCQITAGDTNNTLLAAGGASGSSTSVYLVNTNPNKGVSLAVGKEGNLEMLPWTPQQIITSGSGKSSYKNMAMVSAFIGWFGMTAVSPYSVFRFKGFDGATGPTLGNPISGTSVTDGYIAQLLELVPVQFRANLHLFINRHGAAQLQRSRSALGYQPASTDGSGAFPGLPTASNGIPITVTEAITSTET